MKKTTIGSVTQKNVYDADGSLLLRVDSSSGNTLYVGMTELRTAAGSTVVAGTRTYSALGVPVAERTTQAGVSGSVVRWLTTDLVGTSQLEIHNTTGVQTRRYTDPFGKPKGVVPSWSSDHGYLNAPTSTTTGLTHLGARDYDPNLGRFTTVDAVLAPGNPQQNNGYSYAGNNPVTRSDPTGNCYTAGDHYYAGSCTGAPKTGTNDGSPSAPPPPAGNGTTSLDPMAWTDEDIDRIGESFAEDSCQIARQYAPVGSCNAAEGAASDKEIAKLLSSASETATLAFSVCMADFANPYCGGFSTSALFARSAADALFIEGAAFAQTTASFRFSVEGGLAGRTIDDVAGALRSGALSPSDIPVEIIIKDGNALILNTRTALSLEQAGISRSQWYVLDVTGDLQAEARLAAQLRNNGLTSEGTMEVRITGR